MRLTLRGKIMLFTVLPLATLAIAALLMVNRSVSQQLHHSLQDDLRRSSAVFENMLDSQARALAIQGRVIARDPRFFSILTLPDAHRDPATRATVIDVARDFNSITRSDVFEVLDEQGNLISSIGREKLDPRARRKLRAPALDGKPGSGIVVHNGAQYQVAATPVVAGGRVVGALLLGSRIGAEMAEQLRSFTRSEVTFFAGQIATVSTLGHAEDRQALDEALNRIENPNGLTISPNAVLDVRTPRDVYLTLARAIPQTPPETRQVYVMQRSISTETAFLREIKAGLIELGIVTIIVALLAGFLIAERILAPVRRLVRGAEEMEQGNYDYPLAIRTHDEIGYLAARFDEMRQQQRAYVSSLQEQGRIKSDFITVASHELRTPISIVRGYQQLMTEGLLGPVTPEQRAALESISRSVGDLTRIAEDATRMAQIQDERLALARQEHPVASLVEEAVQTAIAEAPERRLKIWAQVEPGLGTAYVDGPRIVQAVANLVRNGIRFTPDGGEVSVSARRDGDLLEIVVRDTGVGIPADKQAHVFERAHMVRDSMHHHSSGSLEFNSSGLGLGLSIAAGIIEAHGGSVRLESEPGRGSTFTARFPLEHAPEMEQAA